MVPNNIRIYFSGSIRGGRQDAGIYNQLISFMKTFGNVLTEHIGRIDLVDEREIAPREIHDRDMDWLESSDVIIAEVTTPSLGVGYELGRGVEMGKPILCLYRKSPDRRLSGMISGAPGITTFEYDEIDEAMERIGDFIQNIRTD